jgi:hypothetical protein
MYGVPGFPIYGNLQDILVGYTQVGPKHLVRYFGMIWLAAIVVVAVGKFHPFQLRVFSGHEDRL